MFVIIVVIILIIVIIIINVPVTLITVILSLRYQNVSTVDFIGAKGDGGGE